MSFTAFKNKDFSNFNLGALNALIVNVSPKTLVLGALLALTVLGLVALLLGLAVVLLAVALVGIGAILLVIAAVGGVITGLILVGWWLARRFWSWILSVQSKSQASASQPQTSSDTPDEQENSSEVNAEQNPVIIVADASSEKGNQDGQSAREHPQGPQERPVPLDEVNSPLGQEGTKERRTDEVKAGSAWTSVPHDGV